MKAGRALDAIVAVKVMGWVRYDGKSYAAWCEKDWSPSTDNSDAWSKLVEKMKADGWRVTVTDDPDDGAGAQFEKADDNGPEYELAAEHFAEQVESVPHAICLAACRALDVEVPA